MCDIFKNCRKAFDKKCNRNGSQINELVEHQLQKIVKYSIKKKNGVCWDENNMGS